MEILNLKEFKELMQRYRDITLEEIEQVTLDLYNSEFNGGEVAEQLTGFGCNSTCTLCKAVGATEYLFCQPACKKCVWGPAPNGCCKSDNQETYDAIDESTDEYELLEAFKARATHMHIHLEYLNRK